MIVRFNPPTAADLDIADQAWFDSDATSNDQPTGASVPPSDAWDSFLDVVTSPIIFLPSDELHERAWQLGLAAGLTTHDALYLALAEQWGAELWTLDAVLGGPGAARFAAVRDLSSVPFPHGRFLIQDEGPARRFRPESWIE